ncbi:MAG: carbohydrate kinase family protein [Candidatus Eisenbacteria bacterium]
MTRVAVIGTINHDRIIAPDGAVHEDLGGILYNVLTLAPFAGEDVRVVPVARLGAEQRPEVERLLASRSNVDLSRLLWSDSGTNETVLRYLGPDEREETLIERIEPLTAGDLAFARECDLLLVNMIWGKEVTPPLLALLASGGAPLLLDIQSLTLTFQSGPDRGYRNIPEWREWARPASMIKGNEEEVRWFLGEGGPFGGTLREGAELLLGAGPAAAVITRATAGFSLAWKTASGVRWMEAPAVPVPREEWADMTGCGDAFTSGYALGLLRGESPPEAALLGAALGALVCRTRGLRALRNLGDPLALREAAYGDLLRALRERAPEGR